MIRIKDAFLFSNIVFHHWPHTWINANRKKECAMKQNYSRLMTTLFTCMILCLQSCHDETEGIIEALIPKNNVPHKAPVENQTSQEYEANTESAAKYIILMISDGQGFGSVMATDFYTGYPAVYETFPYKYFMTTFSSIGRYDPDTAWDDFQTQKKNPTDSAAAATAMATGVKTFPYLIGKTNRFHYLKNIVETASGQGLATGVVTSVQISHATPAGMVAHNNFRNNYEEIALEMIYQSELDVIMGAGHPWYDSNGEKKNPDDFDFKYVGGETAFSDLTDDDGARAKDGKMWDFIEDREDFQMLADGFNSSNKVFGMARVAKTLQQERNGDPQRPYFDAFTDTVPTLSLMTLGALNVLEQDENGFFLMIEGGAVDWSNHDNQKGRLIEEQTDFNESVQAVVDWIEDDTNGSTWDNALLIVTADHECGYLWGAATRDFILVGDNGPGNIPDMTYHSGNHSNTPVPLYANGGGSDMFDTLIDGNDEFFANLIAGFDPGFDGAVVDNTDIFIVMNEFLKPEAELPFAGLWLKGDLHSHSLHSDGDSPVADVLISVEAKGLDFFALAEHDGNMFEKDNFDDVWPTHWDDPDYVSDQTILLYGVEWTSGMGHANVWSSHAFDYTDLWFANGRSHTDGRDPDPYDAIQAAHEQDALFSINHPTANFCCPWEMEVENDLDCLEVWNALYRLPNLNALASHPFWDNELKKGRRFTAVGGSDTHNLHGIEAWAFGHGNPTTWVYAAEKTGDAVLDGIRAGHVSISWAPDAPRLEFIADIDQDGDYETLMGDNFVQPGNREIAFRVEVHPADPSQDSTASAQADEISSTTLGKLASREIALEDLMQPASNIGLGMVVVLKNGVPFRAWIVDDNRNSVTFTDTPETIGRTYYRAKLIGRTTPSLIKRLLYGWVKAMTNPIYVNFPNK